MGLATAQLVGNVATEVTRNLENPGHERASFRVVSTERRRDQSGVWVDGDEFGVKVVCWGALARGVAASVRVGDPVIVSGRLATKKWDDGGEAKFYVELKATSVGHDLTRGRSTFVKHAASMEQFDSPEPTENAAVEELMAV